MAEIDFVIPVYNEGDHILPVFTALKKAMRVPFRVLICYDLDSDTTVSAIRAQPPLGIEIVFVKNEIRRGPHGAVLSGFKASTAPAVIMIPADDDYNGPAFQAMYDEFKRGYDLVCASRFMPGGCMEGCAWLKATLVKVAAFTLRHLARLPTHDATNGLRLFSRALLQGIQIESTEGFTYSIELLVKAHRFGWKISEVPAQWHERKKGQSNFKVIQWLGPYLKWYFYAFSTSIFRKKIPLKADFQRK